MKLDLEVADGDLVVMGGGCQKTHKHEVPKTKQLVDRHINAAFRTFAKRECRQIESTAAILDLISQFFTITVDGGSCDFLN